MTAPVRHEEDPSASRPESWDERTLDASARKGSLLAVVQTVVGKAAAAGSQFALAWFLLPEQIGIATFAISVNLMLTFLNPLIMSDVLLARRDRLREDAAPAFWTLIGSGLLSTAFLLAMIPPVLAWKSDPRLAVLLGILSVRPLLLAFQIVPYTLLRDSLRFGDITRVNVIVPIFSLAVAVAVASLGGGSLAVVLPSLLVVGLTSYLFATRARPMPSLRPTLAGAGPLFREYATLSTGQYAHSISLFVDYIALGLLATQNETGLYFLAFNLSAQINGVFAYNVSVALQPVFAHLNRDPAAQRRSFLKNTAVIGAATAPLVALQGIIAVPFMHLVLPERWWPAAPLLMVLAAGQIFYFGMGCSTALLKAQGRFHAYTGWQAGQSALLVPAVFLAAGWIGPIIERRQWVDNGAAFAVACVIALQYALSCPFGAVLATRARGAELVGVLGLFGKPIAAAAIAAVPAVPLALLSDGHWLNALLSCIGATAVFVPAYLAAIRLLDRELFARLLAGIRGGWTRVIGRIPGRRAVGNP